MRFKKLLAAVDFSPPSREAFNTATAMAADTGAELVLLHVAQPNMFTSVGGGVFPPYTNELEYLDTANSTIMEWQREAKEAGAKLVSTSVIPGVPLPTIVDLLRVDPTYDLLVMGTHGRTGIKRAVLGSVTEKVVRHAPCPVLVVHVRE